MKVRLLNGKDVRALLSVERCIDLMRQSFSLVAQDHAIQPIRTVLRHPDKDALISMMPGYTADPHWLGIKVVSVFPTNFTFGMPSHQGFVLLFEPERGCPVAIVDGREVTSIRTAAASAVATDVLAPPEVSTLGIIGYGEQASAHLDALPVVRHFEGVLVWGRDFSKTVAFCDQAKKKHDCEPVRDVRDLVERADVICTTTAAAEPLLAGKWLRPGQHLNVVGSSIPSTAEIDMDAVMRCRYFVDFKDSAMQLAGEFRRALDAGTVTEGHIVGSVGEVLVGRVVGRAADEDITLFKSLGMISEDMVTTDFLLHESERMQVGVLVDW